MHVTYAPDDNAPVLRIQADLDEGFHHSLHNVLRQIASEYHGYIIGHVTDILSEHRPHAIIKNNSAQLHMHNGEGTTPLFEVNHAGYIPHSLNVHPEKFITSTGGRVMGKEPNYYISDLDAQAYPHRMQTAMRILEPNLHVMPKNTPRVGIFTGLDVKGDMKKIASDYFHPEILSRAQNGTLQKHHIPTTVRPFVRVHALPPKQQ
jgi:hypothetical protein